jgi:hypothetical protein
MNLAGAKRDGEVADKDDVLPVARADDGKAAGRPPALSAGGDARAAGGKDERQGGKRDEGRRAASIRIERADRRSLGASNGTQNSAPSGGANGGASEVLHASSNEGRETEIVVEMRGQAQSYAPAANDAEISQKNENALARELRQNVGGEIVRQAQVMLRGEGEGTIRLSLKPESLGNVKIRLEMSENKVTGKIIVESGEAFRAFEREIGNLEQIFRDSGFDGASLNMAFASGEGRGGETGGELRERLKSLTEGYGASRYDAEIESAGEADYSFYGGKQINVFA